ncbi:MULTISPECIES: nucleotidyltransferase family protein [unclassified Modicisalibacter]|uniref:nucleotidyltransferase family protein n=1 Tax=unclassified Modicisalibacter TaxID=2679913 RepID=UPI001CCB5504|nr:MULTISPECIES: nucleotidyltransferase family protein [unclassified Modicisalibacter]MBZ9560025.1 nucleotidyltransferase family protein [Modicisalibacter sp. R2A 31.J]MBZ9575934.1 nucleotidyltransferase family protein [Modicisalibacter sp. MOD 31.J]
MFEKLLTPPQRNVLEALHQLEETRRKVLFVVDDSSRLLGTLTDGDVRRWILGGGDLAGQVGAVCNTAPFTARENDDLAEVGRTMRRLQITAVPVVDDGGRVVDAHFWESLCQEGGERSPRHHLNLPVVVMAGGKGTRLAPFTDVLPKPLIPVGDKTAIEIILDSFVDYGVDDFYLSVNYKSRMIQAYFEEREPAYRLQYLYEEKPLGTGGSLSALSGKLDGDLIVTNCDVIVRADYHAMVEHHRRENNDITVVVSMRSYDIPYGICDIVDNGQLCAMREKPHYDFMVNTGLYILRASTLDLVPPNAFYHLTDLIDDVRARGGRVGVYPISEKAWLDTGEWRQYCETLSQIKSA